MYSTKHAASASFLRRSLAIALAGAVSLSCSPSREGRGDSGASKPSSQGIDSGRTAIASTPGGPAASARHVGELPRPIEDMIKTPAELSRFIKPIKWMGHTRLRKCEGCSKIQFTRVRIGAVEDAHTVSYDVLPAYGVLMVRLENLDTRTEAKYGIPGKETWYVLWGGTGTPPVARLVRRMISQSHDTSYTLVPGFSQPISDCKDGHTSTAPDADFKSCPMNAADTTQNAALAASAGVWVSCSQGCCTSDTGPLHGPKR